MDPPLWLLVQYVVETVGVPKKDQIWNLLHVFDAAMVGSQQTQKHYKRQPQCVNEEIS